MALQFTDHFYTMTKAFEAPPMKVFVKDQKDFRYGLVPEPEENAVQVYVVAVHADPERNKQTSINLNRCVPIEGYVYNQITDKYAVECFDAMNIGFVPVAYKLRLEGVGNWSVYVPMPEAVLKRYMTSDQRRMLAAFKAQYRDSGEQLRYEYVQMLSAYPHG